MRPTLATIRSTRSILISLVFALLVVGSPAIPVAAGDGAAGTVAATRGAPTGSAPEPYLLEVGRPFPLLVLPAAADGRPLSLADFRGRKTILHVFASW